MPKLKKIAKDIFTESDGESFELVSIVGSIALVAALVFQGYALFYKDKEFSMMDFGTGIGLLLAGIGGGAKLRPQAYYPQQSYYSRSASGPMPRTDSLE